MIVKNSMKREKANMLLSMEYIVNHINNEELLLTWWTLGVADGDITVDTTTDELMHDEYYMDDDNFSEIMNLFLKLMNGARKDGGLYAGGVTSK